MITRQEVTNIVKQHVRNGNLIKHLIAVSAVMRGLAQHFGEDPYLWEAVGMLHDIDYEEVGQDWNRHGAVSADIVKNLLPEEGLHAIRAHNPQTGSKLENRMDISLFAADALSGLVIAMALMVQDKKIVNVKVSSLVKRMKDKSFARGVSRENIMKCSEIGLSLEEFLSIGLSSMQEVAVELGL